jgi:hypothetical protein
MDLDQADEHKPGESLSMDERKLHLEKMREKAAEYLAIIKKEKSNYYKKEGELGFVVNIKWFRQWEKMVYLSDFTHMRDPDFDEDVIISLDEMTNDELLYAKNEIWADSDEENYCNNVIKSQFRMARDYKVVSESIWTLFKEQY